MKLWDNVLGKGDSKRPGFWGHSKEACSAGEECLRRAQAMRVRSRGLGGLNENSLIFEKSLQSFKQNSDMI